MLIRLMIGAGLFAAGYYLGKQIGITEPIRREMADARNEEADEPRGEELDDDRR